MRVFSFHQLSNSDLIVEAIYEGQIGSQLGGEAISSTLPGIGNLGGFRVSGLGDDKKFVVLYSSGEDPDWPDVLDPETGCFTYYGDNKNPGHEIHDTQPRGNALRRRACVLLHAADNQPSVIPPFFIFQKYPTTKSSRSAQFRGLAVPGAPSLPATLDLVALWKTTNGQRFQNYKAIFTVLDVPIVSRAWIEDLINGQPLSANAPQVWLKWVATGRYQPLTSQNTVTIRSLEEQTPNDPLRVSILSAVWKYFANDHRSFEPFAARIFQMLDQRAIIDEITRGSVDGGRDAMGRYRLGVSSDPVHAEFSLEAKCYRPGIDSASANTVGVRDVARLVSRLRHRQFGVLVTTSAIAKQAYTEIREDGHPVLFICGKDITDILIENGYADVKSVSDFLAREFPIGEKN